MRVPSVTSWRAAKARRVSVSSRERRQSVWPRPEESSLVWERCGARSSRVGFSKPLRNLSQKSFARGNSCRVNHSTKARKERWVGGPVVLAAAQGVVEPEELLEDARARRAVQERVVISPDEVEVVVGQSEEGKTHEGKSGEVESATAVVVEEAPEASLALFGREP